MSKSVDPFRCSPSFFFMQIFIVCEKLMREREAMASSYGIDCNHVIKIVIHGKVEKCVLEMLEKVHSSIFVNICLQDKMHGYLNCVPIRFFTFKKIYFVLKSDPYFL